MPVDFFVGLFVLLGLAVLVVAVFRHFGLSPILGYLAVGLIAGPNGLGLLPDSEETRFLAELGVVFLMFTIGLEFTLPELLANRRQVLGMGGAEVLVVTLLGYGAGVWLGLDDQAAILVGGALAMSSTAVVIKQLAEQMELATRHGRASVAVLLFQDVATLPFLILLGSMGAAQAGSGMGLPVRLLVAVLVFAGLYLAGRWLARPFLHWIARAQSTELFMLAALFIVIGAALVVHEAGLSAPLGAFLAGMVLGETEFRHQVESDIRPFREVLLGLFFATVGMLLDPRLLLEHGWAIAGLALLIVLGKGVLISLLARLFGESPMASIQTGISLAQAGEFGLLLVAGMLSLHALPGDMGQILLGAMILSMALAPILIRHNRRLAEGLLHRESHAQFAPEIALQQESADLQGHVLIVGFGRIGQNLATLLQEDQFDYLALDLDATRVRHAREAGLSVVYGDASRRAVLEGVGVMRASALVITHDQTEAAMRTVSQARQMNPDLTILVRTKDDRHIDELLEAGATEVLPEGLEASLMLGAQLLILLGRPESEVAERMAEIRAERYHVLRSFIHSHGEGEADRSYRAHLQPVALPAHAHAVGRRLDQLQLPAEVVAIRRGGILVPAPQGHAVLREGDIVLLRGTPEAVQHAAEQLLRG